MAKWARDYERCVDCGRVDRRHAGKGLCACCYKRRKFGCKRRYNRLNLGKRPGA